MRNFFYKLFGLKRYFVVALSSGDNVGEFIFHTYNGYYPRNEMIIDAFKSTRKLDTSEVWVLIFIKELSKADYKDYTRKV